MKNRNLALSDLPPFKALSRLTPTFAKPGLRRIYLPIFRHIATLRLVRLALNRLSSPISHLDINSLHSYWMNPDSGSLPETYIGGEAKSRFLLEIISRYKDTNAKTLEVGCNVGRNLNYLFKAGFKNLEGIEINTDAVKALKHTYPEMASLARIHNIPIEEIITELRDGQYDIVFTMAVLMHIHTKSEWIFSEMARITKGVLVTVEAEWIEDCVRFPRNYREIFESLGMKQVEELTCGNLGYGLDYNFAARVFEK